MSLFPAPLLTSAQQLMARCMAAQATVAVAESCTGGLLAGLLTELPGSSAFFTQGFVTYSNSAKTQMLGVKAALLTRYGAVSEQVAKAMAEGALQHAQTTFAVAITGVAGPGGGSADKPVGLVHIALAGMDATQLHQRYHFTGTRSEIRLQAVAASITLLQQALIVT